MQHVSLNPVPQAASKAPKPARLGEEVPLFCERCGYALHGLPQVRCGECALLHFACPECGHHQPINTLRPAAQKFFGRLRAMGLVLSVIFRILFFGWLLIAWFMMGHEWSYRWNYRAYMGSMTTATTSTRPSVPPQQARPLANITPTEISTEMVVAFSLFGLAFGLLSRMLLLRWQRGYVVGAILAGVALTAVCMGAWIRGRFDMPVPADVPTIGFFLAAVIGGFCIIVGAVSVWPIWLSLVHLFLPQRTAAALLDWQRSFSIPSAAPPAALARD